MTVKTPAPKWKPIDEGGQTHVALVAPDGTILDRLSGPSGPRRFGNDRAARDAARAANRKD